MVCFIGDLSYIKGGHNLVDFALSNPHLNVHVFGNNIIERELPANVTLKKKLSNKEIIEVLSAAEYFFYKPVWPEPGSRIVTIALFSGCKIIINENNRFQSFSFYPDNLDEARQSIHDVPCHFWVQVKKAIIRTDEKVRWKNVLVYKSFGGIGDFLSAFAKP